MQKDSYIRTISLGALALFALFIGGCGGGSGGDSDPGVASVGSSSATGDSSQGSASGGIPTEGERGEGDLLDEALAYADCLRANGLPNYPDPKEDPGGLVVYTPPPNKGSGLSLHSPQVVAASRACAKQRGAVFGPPSADRLEQIKKEALEHVECMRARGFDLPDPIIDSRGVESGSNLPEAIVNLPGFAEAEGACFREEPASP